MNVVRLWIEFATGAASVWSSKTGISRQIISTSTAHAVRTVPLTVPRVGRAFELILQIVFINFTKRQLPHCQLIAFYDLFRYEVDGRVGELTF